MTNLDEEQERLRGTAVYRLLVVVYRIVLLAVLGLGALVAALGLGLPAGVFALGGFVCVLVIGICGPVALVSLMIVGGRDLKQRRAWPASARQQAGFAKMLLADLVRPLRGRR